jgi:hypothetical protein
MYHQVTRQQETVLGSRVEISTSVIFEDQFGRPKARVFCISGAHCLERDTSTEGPFQKAYFQVVHMAAQMASCKLTSGRAKCADVNPLRNELHLPFDVTLFRCIGVRFLLRGHPGLQSSSQSFTLNGEANTLVVRLLQIQKALHYVAHIRSAHFEGRSFLSTYACSTISSSSPRNRLSVEYGLGC